MTGYTSIQILPKTRKELASLKGTKRETYDELLKKLMELVPRGDEEGEYAGEFRVGLLNARLDLRNRRAVPLSDVKKSLGLVQSNGLGSRAVGRGAARHSLA